MKVIYSVGATLGSGGVGVHAGEAVKQLFRAGVLEKVICAGVKKGDSSYAPMMVNLGAVPVEAPWRLPAHRYFYPNWLKDTFFDLGTSVFAFRYTNTKPDFFHTWNGHGFYSMRKAKKLGLRTVVERNSLYPLEQEAVLEKEFKKLGLVYKPTHPLSLKRNLAELGEADYVTTPSRLVYDSLLLAGLPKEKLWQPNALGVDFEKFKVQSPNAKKISKSKSQDEELNFVFVGGDPIRKGLYYLLKAWEQITKSQQLVASSQRLFLLGLPPRTFDSRPFLQFKGLAGVEDVGWANSSEYYQKSHVFVLPSIEDGWGLVVGEAMAAGLPVIVSEGAGAADMVTPGSGFRVPAGDWQALHEKMHYFVSDPRKAFDMGKAAQKAIREFSWERYGEQLLRNYKNSC
ncbi:MAG: glycosyltransferase family 4 protein [bacterium]